MDWATEYLFGQSPEPFLAHSHLSVAQFAAAVEKSLKGVTRRVMLSPILAVLPKDQAWYNAFTKVNHVFDHHIEIALANFENLTEARLEASAQGSESQKSFVLLRELVQISQDRDFLLD